MQINYEKEAKEVISRLEQSGYCADTIGEHKRCYDGLQSHLAATGLPFTMQAALGWLENGKKDWSHRKYNRYRYALYRLERYLMTGSIARGSRSGLYGFANKGRLTEQCNALLQELRVALSSKHRKHTVERYAADCMDFLVFLSEQGVTQASEISVEQIAKYWTRVSKMQCSDDRKRRYNASAVTLLTFLAERGDIPYCYSNALTRGNAVSLMQSSKPDTAGTAFQPSKRLESLAVKLLSSLDDQRYSSATKKKYRNDLANYFLFIEVNRFEHSPGSVKSWLEHIPKNTLWERRRHNLALFEDYLATGSAYKKSSYTWQPLQIDSLPDWSRGIILGFVAERQREGLSQATLKMCRVASCRFFKFLDSEGVRNAQEITPELIREFHNADKHSTPMGKNIYRIKVRQLLSYMAELKLVPQSLYLAISTQCAPSQNIVSVMSADMEAAVYRYRAGATTPLELRNAAIVMLGLRIGVRASDIVNLKITDFNWQERIVSFVQIKTGKHITLPVPTDVGNTVYKYITEGRPKSSTYGDGYVFIRHHAPFSEMKTIQACRFAFERIMSEYGLELPSGQGFHITRKTFATRLLTSNNTIDDISNALGHAMPKTVEPYLQRDEEQMRLCPLPFESVGGE